MSMTVSPVASSIILSSRGQHSIPGLSFARRLKSGGYTWENPQITRKEFPLTFDEGSVFEHVVFDFKRDIDLVDANHLISIEDPENPWEPARIDNILSFGAIEVHKRLRFQYKIMATGSVSINGKFKRCVVIVRGGDSRYLDLGSVGKNPISGSLFLAVRKVRPPSQA